MNRLFAHSDSGRHVADKDALEFSCLLRHKRLVGGDAAGTKLTAAHKKSAETLRLELELLPGHERQQK